jgi:hypothetical protein
MKEELGDAAYESMPREEREDREDEIAAVYDKEFEKRGLKRLRLEASMRSRRRRDAINEQLKKLFGG